MTAGSDGGGSGRPDAHPDLETLAELQESLLDSARERRVRRHVAKCEECGSALAALDTTRQLLADLPPVTMPADVAARLDEALAVAGTAAAEADAGPEPAPAPATTIVPPPHRTPWWRSSGFATSAAAAAVVLLIAGVVAGALHTSHRGGNTSSTSAGRGESANGTGGVQTFSATASGRDYTAGSLAAALPALLGKPAPAPSGSVSGGAKAFSNDAAGSTSGRAAVPAPAPATAQQPLAQPQKLADCIAALIGRPAGAVTPLAVDLAEFQGKPAAVIVLPSTNRPALVDIWVVGPGCSAADQQFMYFLRAPRPS